MVSAALRANRAAIKEWARSATSSGTKTFTYAAGREIGYGVVRGSGQVMNMSNVTVVLRKTIVQNRVYFVLTAFPKP